MVVQGGDSLVGVASEVAVTGTETVRVGSVGSVVELSGSNDEMEYTMYQWRSSDAFDEYTNVVPLMSDAEELIVRGASAGGIRAVSSGEITVHIEVQASSGAWS
jgi:hypothetical protein